MNPIRLLVLALLITLPARAGNDADRWWPTQAFPKTVVRTTNQQEFPEPRLALQMLVQSIAGLAAQAVNEGRGNELVWVNNGGGDLEKWYGRLMLQHPGLALPGALAPWDLVDRYTKQGLVKGYILYRSDKSMGDNNTARYGMDCSVNIATSLAGLLDGIIVDENLEPVAKAHGLKLLMDVRDKTPAWCFQTYRDQFNQRMICFQDPRAPHVRDLAIAQRVFTTVGHDEPTAQALAWLQPLSPILGWNCGDEFQNTDQATVNGDIQTASNWSLNLPVLMAGTEQAPVTHAHGFDPRKIDWSDTRSAVAFINTDGDNVQWQVGNYFSNPSYWGNPTRGKIPFGWSSCFAHLAQVCPEELDALQATRTPNDSFIEWGGGYYYPDHFGSARANRWELLATHARRTWNLMKTTNTRMIGFNFSQLNSPDAHLARKVYIGQTDGLLAMLAFQYYPYEGGAGEVFWVRDRSEVEVPVITARYTLWANSNNRERAGTPAKIAREIQATVAASGPQPRYDWVIAHAWSYFQPTSGTDEDAENLSQDNAANAGGMCGYSPVTWCADRLPASIRVVSPEELAWRIRMQHDPVQTKKLIADWQM